MTTMAMTRFYPDTDRKLFDHFRDPNDRVKRSLDFTDLRWNWYQTWKMFDNEGSAGLSQITRTPIRRLNNELQARTAV
jgi:hypothetical protein